MWDLVFIIKLQHSHPDLSRHLTEIEEGDESLLLLLLQLLIQELEAVHQPVDQPGPASVKALVTLALMACIA